MSKITKARLEEQGIGHVIELDSNALAGLSQKIQDNLKTAQSSTLHRLPSIQNPATNRARSISEKGTLKVSKSSFANQQRGAESHRASSAAQNLVQKPSSVKRLRDGKAKVKVAKDAQNVRSDVNKTKLGTRPVDRPTEGKLSLEDEVLALGGDSQDLELLTGAGSDSELDGDLGSGLQIPNGSFQRDFQGFFRELGIDPTIRENFEREEEDAKNIDNPYHSVTHMESKRNASRDSSREALHEQLNGYERVLEKSNAKKTAIARLKVSPQSNWYAVELLTVPETVQPRNAIPTKLLDRIHEYAKSLLERENTEYAAQQGSSTAERKFYATLMSTGTLSDKISALTLSVQESPLHNMRSLESLINLARKRSREQAVNVLGALKDLFGPGNLLPSDRRLRVFASQAGLSAAFNDHDPGWTSASPLPKPLNETHLIVWAYEDWLKSIYFEILTILESWCNDEVTFARTKAVDYISSLLKEKPEQEANLLRLLVNKLGDKDKKIASKSSYQILQLQTTHPLMKPILISTIESDLLFRPGQSLHAKYYAVITLNQTILSDREKGVAQKLLDIYFGLFIKLLKKPETVARQIETARVDKISINSKGEIQGGGSAGGKKAQKKLLDKEKSTAVEEDLREKMLSAVLTGVNRAMPYTNINGETFERHLDTLFRVTHSSNFNTSIQALMLIQQLNGAHHSSQDRFYRVLYESILDPRLLVSSKQALYLNLLFRALRADINLTRVKAFVKRLLQVVTMHQPSFVCGIFYLLRELEKVFPSLPALIDLAAEDVSDEEEVIHDVREETGLPMSAVPGTAIANKSPCLMYDPRKRDPNHANASSSPLWELPPLTTHYHPSVTLFAARLLSHDPMPPKPDLQQNTLISFLDKFVYKTPKTSAGSAHSAAKGASIMQPLASGGGDDSSVLLSTYSGISRAKAPINSDSFWRRNIDKVGVDEVFFHRYFSTMGAEKDKANRKKDKKDRKKRGGDLDDDGSGEEEEEIWKALVDSKPEIEGDDDEDVEFSDDEELIEALQDDSDSQTSMGVTESDEEEVMHDLDGASSDLQLESDGDRSNGVSVSSVNSQRASTAEADLREKRGAKRRRMKNLPTFADADEYAEMLEDEMSDGR